MSGWTHKRKNTINYWFTTNFYTSTSSQIAALVCYLKSFVFHHPHAYLQVCQNLSEAVLYLKLYWRNKYTINKKSQPPAFVCTRIHRLTITPLGSFNSHMQVYFYWGVWGVGGACHIIVRYFFTLQPWARQQLMKVWTCSPIPSTITKTRNKTKRTSELYKKHK